MTASFLKNVVRKSQFTSRDWIGEMVSDASMPRFRSLLSELKIRVSCPELGASVCSSSRSLMLRWYTEKLTSARPPASCASNPASISVCRSGLMNGSPARFPGSTPKIPPMVPVVSGENLAPKSGWLPVCRRRAQLDLVHARRKAG